MMIDIKEIQNQLYVCNVNFYDMYVDTEAECITIEMDELMETVALDRLIEGLEKIFDEVECEEGNLVLYFNQ